MGKKRAVTIVLAVVLVLGLAGTVWAATAARPPVKLSEAQRREMLNLHRQMLELRKQIVKKQVEFKVLTPAEGKAAEARLDVMAERMADWDGTCGPGMGMGMGMGRGRRGGMRSGGPRGGWRGQAGACPNCGASAK